MDYTYMGTHGYTFRLNQIEIVDTPITNTIRMRLDIMQRGRLIGNLRVCQIPTEARFYEVGSEFTEILSNAVAYESDAQEVLTWLSNEYRAILIHLRSAISF